MIIFGLTGGIACGKSTATKTFRKHGIPMVDADVVARQVVEPGTYGEYLIKENFGSDFFASDGSLDRSKLGQLVFSKPEALDLINKLIGPLVNQEADKQINELRNHGYSIIGYDAALICEMGNSKKYRPLIVVHCSADTQIARLMSRNSLTRAEAMARIAAQIPGHEKLKFADFTIDTSGTINNSIEQTEAIIKKLKSLQNKF